MSSAETLKNSAIKQGPDSYENWKAFNQGKPFLSGFEYEMYTDAWLTGEIKEELGPYQFLNLVSSDFQTFRARPKAVLRLHIHLENNIPNVNEIETDSGTYHGGGLADEMAALASLFVGCRFQVWREIRTFAPDGEPGGRPMSSFIKQEPQLSIGLHGRILPTFHAQHSLMLLGKIALYPKLTPEKAIALIRAARFYQNAVWVAESEPSLAWLMIASAVETIANCWRREQAAPLDRLRAAKPDFVKFVEEKYDSNLVDKIAETFADSIGSTKKFCEFLVTFQPEAPQVRPLSEWAQVLWTEENLLTAFRLIYRYRSKALHEGIPFPDPMCRPPFKAREEWVTVTEKPLGEAMMALGGVWKKEDVPMHFHIFEYIVRSAIVKWFESECFQIQTSK